MVTRPWLPSHMISNLARSTGTWCILSGHVSILILNLTPQSQLIKNYRQPMTVSSKTTSRRGSIKILITNFGSIIFLLCVSVKIVIQVDGRFKDMCSEFDGVGLVAENCLSIYHFIFAYKTAVPGERSNILCSFAKLLSHDKLSNFV